MPKRKIDDVESDEETSTSCETEAADDIALSHEVCPEDGEKVDVESGDSAFTNETLSEDSNSSGKTSSSADMPSTSTGEILHIIFIVFIYCIVLSPFPAQS